jgi:hypothetical protein
MAYYDFLADRIRQIFIEQNAPAFEKKMMGGLVFMLDDKMCCGISFNKNNGKELLMARIGEKAYLKNKTKSGCNPMDFTGRPMKGYAFIDDAGFDLDNDLEHWIKLCIEFNPQAKSNKK